MLPQSKHLILKTWIRTGSSQRVYPWCGIFHASSIKGLDFEKCGLFHASSIKALDFENLKSHLTFCQGRNTYVGSTTLFSSSLHAVCTCVQCTTTEWKITLHIYPWALCWYTLNFLSLAENMKRQKILSAGVKTTWICEVTSLWVATRLKSSIQECSTI